MAESLQVGIVTAAAFAAVLALALPALRRRAKSGTAPGAPCANCASGRPKVKTSRR